MENKLRNLNKKMNSTIFQEIRFEEKNQKAVLRSVKKSKNRMDFPFFQNKLTSVLSVSVTAFLFFGIVYFAGTKAGLFIEEHQSQNGQTQEPTSSQKTATEDTNKETIFVPKKQKENYNDMSKKEILTMMINSVDNFETAKGRFEIYYKHIGHLSEVEYELSINEQAGGYSKSTQNGNVTYDYYKDVNVWNIDENANTHLVTKYQETRDSGTLSIEDAFKVDDEGNNDTYYRWRPLIGEAMSSLFPYEIASNYTRNLNNWEIEKQNEMLLGHNTVVITGNKNHHDFSSFRLWVNKDTGILIKYETYNPNGDVVDYLHPSKLEVNIPVDTSKFNPNVEEMGYKKQEFSDAGMPILSSGIADADIPAEIKDQWEQAKKKPDETTILKFKSSWYIFPEKGYIVDRIEVNGSKGTLILVKASEQKSQYNIPVLAEGYEIEKLIVQK
ncbi:hypothetical protein [Lederbergia citrea]|uniref:MucB/RseB N-terminal domain-containing protein n=1 Tax=Lederbergia citrea TaxID=2833581 RepID=A0A942Z3S6_9BACI|nr:hypothetical protein [Lederbergia citrea]MBS4221787.1 hypothetical protein [Lederbergia citrea]